MNKVSIVIPVKNSGEQIKHTINSILKSTDYNYEIILIDGMSTDGTSEVLDIYAKQYKQIKVFHVETNGIASAINYGIKKSGNNDVYLTQDDVIFNRLYGRDWLELIVKASQDEKIGLITTLKGGGISGKDYIEGLPWAGTWSLFIPRRTINKIGLFDENFDPGYGDDIDYSYRVQKEGLILAQIDFWVDHHRLGQHLDNSEKSEELKKEHSKYFRKKFGIGECNDN